MLSVSNAIGGGPSGRLILDSTPKTPGKYFPEALIIEETPVYLWYVACDCEFLEGDLINIDVSGGV